MLAFFFWFMSIWMFIAVFSDIFRRNDLSGGAKAGSMILIFVLPLLGILIYVIARPKMTEQAASWPGGDAEERHTSGCSSPTRSPSSPRRSARRGHDSAEEYERLKQQAM